MPQINSTVSAETTASSKVAAVVAAAARCGVPEENLIKLRTEKHTTPEQPHLANYLDLLPGKAPCTPDAVGESADKPLLYFVHRDRLAINLGEHEDELRLLRRALGSRGERAYLAIVEPGVVRVVPVSLKSRQADWMEFKLDDGAASTLFSRLSLGQVEDNAKSPDYVFDAMFNLLDNVARKLAEGANPLDRSDVLSLVGRALFLRFLGDRGIVTEQHVDKIASGAKRLTDCFANARNAAETCAWLDQTFNGDFLKLTQKGSQAWFESAGKQTDGKVFRELSAILHADEPAGNDYQIPLWSDFDFAHVPVGLLSQVYEEFCWRWDHDDAQATSVFYTPRGIASVLVEEAFDGAKNADAARVLDPACGAGVFLVLAFRRLVRAQWEKTGKRPERKEIRAILEKQLCGFDISESALRLAALSLYLTAIELDPEPSPPHALRFNDLQGSVLHHCRTANDPAKGAVLGSLDARMLEGNRGTFQIVLCNPPWTSLGAKDKLVAEKFHGIGREVLVEKKLPELAAAYENPDSVPDLPFVWRAMQWCEHGGRMAFVLPARLLFKQGDIGQRAREAIFRAATVTGMLNCSNLSDTKVWPKMQQPFLLFFAHNRPSKPDHEIRFVTPHHDKALNDRGEIRIDAKSVQLVSQEQTFEEPWLWKALAVGTSLDVDVVRKLKACEGRPLEKYWTEDLRLNSSCGYSVKGSFRLTADDIRIESLRKILSSGDGNARYITGRLHENTKALIKSPDAIDDAVRDAVSEDFNVIIDGPIAYDVKQASQILALTIRVPLPTIPNKREAQFLNRIILEALFPEAIEPLKHGYRDFEDATFLIGLPNVTPSAPFRFQADAGRISRFILHVAERPREPKDFKGPLVLVKEAPGVDRTKGRAWLANEDVAFNESFHGFSGAGNSAGSELVSYLQLVVHSDLWMHYALLTSPKLGAERRKFYKEDLEEFPVIPWANLTEKQREQAAELSKRLLAEDLTVFPEIDDFFAKLYRLSRQDMEVIRDTLSVELPYKSVRNRASLPPSEKEKERETFRARVETILRPFFERLGKSISVTLDTPASAMPTTPFSLLTLHSECKQGVKPNPEIQARVLALTNQTGASMVYLDQPGPALTIGVLNQYRYWTPSRARLCATEILHKHMETFERNRR